MAKHAVVGDDHSMDGLMQDWALTTNAIFRRGARYFGDRTIATRRTDGIAAAHLTISSRPTPAGWPGCSTVSSWNSVGPGGHVRLEHRPTT